MARPFNDLVGKRFNSLTVIRFIGQDKHRNALWEVLCDCGIKNISRGTQVKRGVAKTCGCSKGGIHNESLPETVEYRTWRSIFQRCLNSRCKAYSYYGGRGITICARWQGYFGFNNFLADMGRRPSNEYSIDRINNDGNYEPSNCRWATRSQQQKNRRRCRRK